MLSQKQKPSAKCKRGAKAKGVPSKGGRPSTFNEGLAESICDAIAEGASLRQVCKREDMPDRRTVERWMAADPGFAARCARAREEQAEVHHDQMGEIEAKVLAGKLDPKAANVVLSNKRWRMEKLSPKYGQRVSHELSGPGGGPIRTITTEMTPQEAAAAYASTLNGE